MVNDWDRMVATCASPLWLLCFARRYLGWLHLQPRKLGPGFRHRPSRTRQHRYFGQGQRHRRNLEKSNFDCGGELIPFRVRKDSGRAARGSTFRKATCGVRIPVRVSCPVRPPNLEDCRVEDFGLAWGRQRESRFSLQPA